MSKKAEIVDVQLVLLTLDEKENIVERGFGDCYQTDKNWSLRLDNRNYYLRRGEHYYVSGNYAIINTYRNDEVKQLKELFKKQRIDYWSKILNSYLMQQKKIEARIERLKNQ